MTALLDKQQAFMRAILDEDAPLPDGWGERHAAGMSVYRGNYRAALMDALAASFERTMRYVGEAPFQQACAHHLIAHPPASWTLDDAGQGFDATCAELFGDNPEVGELVWLEWAMLQVGSAPDLDPLTPEEFSAETAQFDDAAWMGLRVEFQPRAEARLVQHDLTALWNALEEDGQGLPDAALQQPMGCIVWREGERPVFSLADPTEGQAFAAMQAGASYGDIIALLAGEEPDDQAVQDAAMSAGAMLGGWLKERMIVALKA